MLEEKQADLKPRNRRTTLGQNTLSDLMGMRSSGHTMKADRRILLSVLVTGFSGAKTKETHSVESQFDYRHSQTSSKFVDDVHSENLVHVSILAVQTRN